MTQDSNNPVAQGAAAAEAEEALRAQAERREARADRMGLVLFVAAICGAFVLLVLAGYGARALYFALARLFT